MRRLIRRRGLHEPLSTGLGAGSALARRGHGNGKPLWTNTTDPNAPHTLHGKSECAFSEA